MNQIRLIDEFLVLMGTIERMQLHVSILIRGQNNAEMEFNVIVAQKGYNEISEMKFDSSLFYALYWDWTQKYIRPFSIPLYQLQMNKYPISVHQS